MDAVVVVFDVAEGLWAGVIVVEDVESGVLLITEVELFFCVFEGDGIFEIDVHSDGVAEEDGDAVDVDHDGEGEGLVGGPEDAFCFLGNFVFFVCDVGDDVAEDVY